MESYTLVLLKMYTRSRKNGDLEAYASLKQVRNMVNFGCYLLIN